MYMTKFTNRDKSIAVSAQAYQNLASGTKV